jgi:hypothetical protein
MLPSIASEGIHDSEVMELLCFMRPAGASLPPETDLILTTSELASFRAWIRGHL